MFMGLNMFENKHIIPLIHVITSLLRSALHPHPREERFTQTKKKKPNQQKTKQNKTKQNKTMARTMQTACKVKPKKMSKMEKACQEGNLQVVKKFLSSHPESITFSNDVVSDFGFVNNDVVFIVISFLMLYLF